MISQMLIYAVLIGMGATLGVWQVSRSAPARQAERWADAALLTLLLALVGARAAHVGLEWVYYAENLPEIPAFWMGGLSWWGAVLGGMFGVLLVNWRLRLGLARTVDGLSRLVAPLAVGVWLGCWQVGSAYGAPMPTGVWWGVPSADEGGVIAARVPLQLFAALLVLVFDWLTIRFGSAYFGSGITAGLTAFSLAAGVLMVSFFSAQPAPQVQGMALDGWIALGLAGFALLMIGWNFIQTGRKSHEDNSQPQYR